jgi:hypothetical protein
VKLVDLRIWLRRGFFVVIWTSSESKQEVMQKNWIKAHFHADLMRHVCAISYIRTYIPVKVTFHILWYTHYSSIVSPSVWKYSTGIDGFRWMHMVFAWNTQDVHFDQQSSAIYIRWRKEKNCRKPAYIGSSNPTWVTWHLLNFRNRVGFYGYIVVMRIRGLQDIIPYGVSTQLFFYSFFRNSAKNPKMLELLWSWYITLPVCEIFYILGLLLSAIFHPFLRWSKYIEQ